MNRIFLFLMLASGFSYASPSFDCGKASTLTEKTICTDKIGLLKDQDSKLSDIYRKNLRVENSDLLKKSQQNWLRFRDKTCASDYELDNENCLHQLYGDRIDELENGIITFHIKASQLPYEIALGDLFKGKLIYSESEISKENEVFNNELSLHLIINERKADLWSVISESPDITDGTFNLNSISIYISKNNNIVLMVDSTETDNAMTSSGTYEINRYRYFVISKSREVFSQGELESGGGEERTSLNINWNQNEVLGLNVTSYRQRYDNFNYLLPVEFTNYEFNLDGNNWKKRRQELMMDLENDENVHKYMKIYQGIDSESMKKNKALLGSNESSSCIENNIDWSEVAQSLTYWMGITMKFDHKMSREQALYAIPKLFKYQQEHEFSKTQRALAIGLNFYRELIESTPQWKEKFDVIAREQDVNINTMTNIGFPSLNTNCSNNIVVTQYEYIKFNRWLYTFWLRRYMDGSYDSAKLIINHYATQD